MFPVINYFLIYTVLNYKELKFKLRSLFFSKFAELKVTNLLGYKILE